MLRNYFKTTLRSLLKHRFFSFINIFGLAIAMSICMGIMMLVADQLMYDRYNTQRDRIFRLNSIPTDEKGNEFSETATTTLPIQKELLENYTGVEKAVRIVRGFGNHWMEIEQSVNIPVAGYFVDPEFIDLFQLELEHGDRSTALNEPYSVVLTKQAARKLFKEENPVGETFMVGEAGPYKVTGVLKETDNKSHIAFEALASIATYISEIGTGTRSDDLDNWYQYTAGWVYILIEPGKSILEIQSHLSKIQEDHFAELPKPETQNKIIYQMQSLTSITPGSFINNPIGPFLPWVFVYFFAGLAGVVMLTSCFNFTNLSIARSLTRAKEIGVRKVTGALRWHVFTQFMSESIIVSVFALILALIMLLMVKPLILGLSFAHFMKWDLETNYVIYAVFIGFALVVGVLAGLFPAVVMSGFKPVNVLKGFSNIKLFSRMGLRKGLLVAQFTFSLIFILSVIVVYNQLQLFLKADHGFNMENKIVVQLSNSSATTLKTELLKHSNIQSVSAASHIPAAGSTRATDFKRALEDKDWTNVNTFSVDEDYLKNIDVELVAGNFYLPESGKLNEAYLVISEKAVEAFQFESAADAIGQEVINQGDSTHSRIIGVIKNYNHQLLIEKMAPLALIYNPSDFQLVQVKYTGDFKDAAASIEQAWSLINPNLKLDYKDFYDEIHKIYDIFFGDLVRILGVISFLAILISCLGLLGMATYTTETRIKEVSIRKVLGSSNGSLVYLLSKGFFIVVLMAILIAVPAAYFVNTLWLEKIAYHVTVDFYVIGLGIALLLLFATITIGSQTWRAVFVNPVDNLKSE